MIKTISLLIISLAFVSCTKDQKKKQKAEDLKIIGNVTIAPSPTVHHESDVPHAAHTWGAEIYMVNFSEEEEAKVHQAVEIIKKVIITREFKERVLSYTFEGQNQFYDNLGFSNAEIYQKILDGAEQIGNSTKNNTMDVELELYTQATTTIGYTYPNTVRIWMNKKYFDRYTPLNVADNLMHEWMHKLGFSHATTWSESRDHSVPYAIGYLVEELAKKLFP